MYHIYDLYHYAFVIFLHQVKLSMGEYFVNGNIFMKSGVLLDGMWVTHAAHQSQALNDKDKAGVVSTHQSTIYFQ